MKVGGHNCKIKTENNFSTIVGLWNTPTLESGQEFISTWKDRPFVCSDNNKTQIYKR